MSLWEASSRVIVSAREGFIWVTAHIVSWLALSKSPAGFRRSQALGIVDRCLGAGWGILLGAMNANCCRVRNGMLRVFRGGACCQM